MFVDYDRIIVIAPILVLITSFDLIVSFYGHFYTLLFDPF